MTDPLDGQPFTATTTWNRGTVISCPGLPTIIVERCWKEWTVQIDTAPLWPPLYVPSVQDAQDYLKDHPGSYVELDSAVRVRWLLPNERPHQLLRGVADLADAMHYATVLGRPL